MLSIMFVDGGQEKLKVAPTNLVKSGLIVTRTFIDSYLDFVEDKTEWNGTKVTFEIAKKGDKTEVRFTHVGLNPDVECYDDCSKAWGSYINGSLRNLITKGKGQPNPKEKRCEKCF